MVVNGEVVEDEVLLRMALRAIARGLREAGADPHGAADFERQTDAYYQFRDEVRESLMAAYERAALRAAQQVGTGRRSSARGDGDQ